MSVASATNSKRASAVSDTRVQSAICEIVDALALKPAASTLLSEFVSSLATPFPKLPHVSFYAAKLRGGGANYRITYRVPSHSTRTERLGKMPKPAYERAKRVSEILGMVKARLMKPDDAHRTLYVDSNPVGIHIDAFERALSSKNSVPRYVSGSVTRLKRCLDLGSIERIGDIRADRLPLLIERLSAHQDSKTGKKLSTSTINDHLATLRQFTKWATPRLLQVDPLANTTGLKNVDQKKRRDVLLEELAEIVATARVSNRRWKMPGDHRAMLYLTAYGTGLRANELRKLEVPWLKLEAESPYLDLPAAIDKARKERKQPIPGWLAAELKAWLGDRKRGPVFPTMPRDVAPLLEGDRELARKNWVESAGDTDERRKREESDFLRRETSDGEIVFHSTKHTYASVAVAATDMKTAQMLTRHATAAMLERYSHSRLKKAAEVAESAITNPIRREK